MQHVVIGVKLPPYTEHVNLHLQPVVRLGEHGGTYQVVRTDLPCTVCNKEIQPGQMYIPGPLGPRHVGC